VFGEGGVGVRWGVVPCGETPGILNGIVFSFIIFRHQLDLVFLVKQVLVQLLDYLETVGLEVLGLVGSPLEEIG
jgi:hypothetical protein